MLTSLKSLSTVVLVCLLMLNTGPSSTAAEQNDTTVYLLGIPSKGWALNIPTWAFTEGSKRVEADVASFNGARAGDKKQKLSPVLINIRMEPAKAPGDAQAVSDFAKKNLRKKSIVVFESLKQSVYKDIPVLRYSIDINPTVSPQVASFPRGKILEAYYVKDDTWITVQLNFLEFRKEDEKFFFGLLDYLRIDTVAK
jgi:hypothetical protein